MCVMAGVMICFCRLVYMCQSLALSLENDFIVSSSYLSCFVRYILMAVTAVRIFLLQVGKL